VSRLVALQPSLEEYLEQARTHLAAGPLPAASAEERDVLHALDDLRAEAAPTLLPLLGGDRLAHPDLAVAVLRWSRDPRVGPRLPGRGRRQVRTGRGGAGGP